MKQTQWLRKQEPRYFIPSLRVSTSGWVVAWDPSCGCSWWLDWGRMVPDELARVEVGAGCWQDLASPASAGQLALHSLREARTQKGSARPWRPRRGRRKVKARPHSRAGKIDSTPRWQLQRIRGHLKSAIPSCLSIAKQKRP